jgi:hypothetical protein
MKTLLLLEGKEDINVTGGLISIFFFSFRYFSKKHPVVQILILSLLFSVYTISVGVFSCMFEHLRVFKGFKVIIFRGQAIMNFMLFIL